MNIYEKLNKSKWVILPKFSKIKSRECTPTVKVFRKWILINPLCLNEFWYISFMLAAWLGQPFCADKPEIYHQSFILTVTSRVKFSSHQFKKCKDQLITSVTLNYWLPMTRPSPILCPSLWKKYFFYRIIFLTGIPWSYLWAGTLLNFLSVGKNIQVLRLVPLT